MILRERQIQCIWLNHMIFVKQCETQNKFRELHVRLCREIRPRAVGPSAAFKLVP